jgi:hypothetical protein
MRYLPSGQHSERFPAAYRRECPILKILGKDFSVDAKGRFFTDIHVNPWVAVPVLDYILISIMPLFTLGTGLVQMFEKITQRHGGFNCS